MIALTKRERNIILFLIVTFALGIGLRVVQNCRSGVTPTKTPGVLNQRTPGVFTEDAALDKIIEQEETININTADMNCLTRLPGVGPKFAERIIEYRQVHGGFKKPEDIKNIKGIGDKKFDKMKDIITVE